MKLSKLSLRLLDEFDEAAQAWGYHSDQGSREEAAQPQNEWETTKEALVKRLRYLERRCKTLSSKVRGVQESTESQE